MRIVIYGAGGFGREMLRFARLNTPAGCEPPVFASDDPGQIGELLNGVATIRAADFRPDDRFVLAVADGAARRKMASRCSGFIDILSPTAVIDEGVALGEGAIFCDYTIVTADQRTKIGRHFHCNFQSHIGHDCIIGDFVTLGPKVGINGNVHIGDEVYVGSGAQIRNGVPGRPLVIGEGAVVGMGAVVTRDVAPGTTVVGNPARPIRRS